METGDEFDNGNTSPVPPHEREWRHPAEVHAAARQRIAAEAAPPPVSRRTTGILAAIGAAATAVLIGVAVPKGVPDGREPTSVTDVAAVVPVSKGADRNTAVEFTKGWFAARASDVSPGMAGRAVSIITADGITHETRHAADLAGLSLSVFVSGADEEKCDFETGYEEAEFRYLLDAGSLSVIDRSLVRHSVRNSLALDSSAQGTVPLHVDTPVDGPGVLVAFDDRPVGLVSVVDHRTVAVLLPGLGELICGA